jgi:hypothetical protein
MKKSSLTAAASILGLALVLSPIATVQAAELQILAGGAMAGPLTELAGPFESASGHKLVFRFGTRMVKKFMRPHARSISATPRAVRDTVSGLHALPLG